jgi:uncharacterized protein
MSGQSNLQLVQQAYQLFKAGNIQAFLDLLAADVLWQMPEIPNVPFAGTWKRNRVVVLGRFTMQVKATGRASCSAWVHVWTVEEGTISAVSEYVDTLAVSRAHNVL